MRKKKLITNKDIFSDWKNNRFVIAKNYLWTVESGFKHLVILTDVIYWAKNSYSLGNWCEQNNCELQGMTVAFPSDKSLTLFCLRWT